MGQKMTFDSSRNDNSGKLATAIEPEMRRVRIVTVSRTGQIRNEDKPWKIEMLSPLTSEANKASRIELFEPELTVVTRLN